MCGENQWGHFHVRAASIKGKGGTKTYEMQAGKGKLPLCKTVTVGPDDCFTAVDEFAGASLQKLVFTTDKGKSLTVPNTAGAQGIGGAAKSKFVFKKTSLKCMTGMELFVDA